MNVPCPHACHANGVVECCAACVGGPDPYPPNLRFILEPARPPFERNLPRRLPRHTKGI